MSALTPKASLLSYGLADKMAGFNSCIWACEKCRHAEWGSHELHTCTPRCVYKISHASKSESDKQLPCQQVLKHMCCC